MCADWSDSFDIPGDPPGEPPGPALDEPPWVLEAGADEAIARILEPLDAEQRRAVTHPRGPLLIVAGAGTGKTTVIARRIAHLIAAKLAHPSEILALTFTERAAAEMEARVDLLTPYGYTDMWISTFHAFGDRIVRDHALQIGLPDDLRVLGEAERQVFLRERLFRLPLRRLMPLANPTRHVRALLAVISRAKDEGIEPEAYLAHARAALAGLDRDAAAELRTEAERQLEIAQVYRSYQEELERAGCLDFGDQILLPLRILRQCPDVAELFRRRFRYILVDEFQDTNVAQFELLKLISGAHANLTVVGDDDQSIYKFRGAAISNILGFTAAFPERDLVVLKRNYRSGQEILDAAYRLIRYNDPDRLEVREGIDKRLFAVRSTPARVDFQHHDSLRAEADGVAARIAGMVRDGGRRCRDIALLVRSNQDALPFLQSLRAAGVPCEHAGSHGLYTRREVQLAVAFLRCVTRRDDSQSLYALAASEVYALPMDDLIRLADAARAHNLGLRVIMERVTVGEELPGQEPVSAAAEPILSRLIEDLERYAELARRLRTGDLLYHFLSESGYLAQLVAEVSPQVEERVRNLTRFFDLITRYGSAAMTDRVHAFVDYQDLLMEAGDDPRAVEPDPDLDVVQVMSVHRAKGLEFPCVFVANLVTRKFPTAARRPPLDLPPGLVQTPVASSDVHRAEERRLFYVAMTRARDLLVLSSAADHGGAALRKVSPFVLEALDLAPAEVKMVRQSIREELQRFGTPVPLVAAPTGAAAAEAAATAAATGAAATVAAPTGQAVPGEASATESSPAISSPAVFKGPIRLSATRIEEFAQCPLRFRYAHVLRMPVPVHHAAAYGSAVHEAIAAYLGSRMRGAPMTVEAVQAVFRRHWRSEGFLSREHEERRLALGLQSLQYFVTAEAASPVVPASVERAFRFTLEGVRVEGRFDRIDLGEEGEGATVIDYKTATVDHVKEAERRARRSLQLKIYGLAYRELSGAAPRWVELRFVETGIRGGTAVSDEDLEIARATIRRTAAAVRAGRFEGHPSAFVCGHCPYRQICPESVRG